MTNVLMIAGETSGDLHGSGVVRELRRLKPELLIWGIGGSRMGAAGMSLEYDIGEMNFLGFSEVVKHLPFLRGVLRKIKRLILERNPGLVILIDYPGFNLRIAKFAHRQGIKVLYYISPQVWAWGGSRVKKIARYVHHLAVIFQFEDHFYRSHQIPVTFVGHPLLESLHIPLSRDEFSRKFDLNPEKPLLALLAGSRNQEVQRILPEMLHIGDRVRRQLPDCQLAVSKADHVEEELYRQMLYNREGTLVPDTYSLMAYSTAMMVASGTATLESAIIGTPFVMVYRVSPVSYWIGKKLVRVDHLAMANIVAQKRIVPEFIQQDFCSTRVVPLLVELLKDGSRRKIMQSGFAEIRAKLGTPGASLRVAKLALSLMKENG